MRAAKVDANQSQIVQALRAVGCTVQCLHTVGQGVPDLLVGFSGKNILVKVKDGPKPKLTPDQVVWHSEWKGQVCVVRSAEDIPFLFI